jgi:hypothetical protein
MGSLIEELRRRETAARAEADRLRARIQELTEELARAEEQVTRLAITREEVTRVLDEPPAAGPARQEGAPAVQPGPHDVIAPPGGRAGGRALRPGPKALANWLAGSVRQDPADMIAAMFDEAGARDPGHLRTWVVLVDGAEHQLGLIRAEAARRCVTIHVVIDIIHVLEYLWGATWSLHEAGDPAAEDWVAVKALAVLAGGSERAAAGITAEADAAGLEGSKRSGADACVRYLGSKREFLRYDRALNEGWPIATGVIRLEDVPLRRRLIKAICRSRWVRMMPDAFEESMEFKTEIARLRPHWLLHASDLSYFHSLYNDWSGPRGVWWRAR